MVIILHQSKKIVGLVMNPTSRNLMDILPGRLSHPSGTYVFPRSADLLSLLPSYRKQ